MGSVGKPNTVTTVRNLARCLQDGCLQAQRRQVGKVLYDWVTKRQLRCKSDHRSDRDNGGRPQFQIQQVNITKTTTSATPGTLTETNNQLMLITETKTGTHVQMTPRTFSVQRAEANAAATVIHQRLLSPKVAVEHPPCC